MKKLLFIIMTIMTITCQAHEGGNFIASNILENMKDGDKAAILMVHFGTTYDDTRAKTIDIINEKVKNTFPELEVREAYTARIVIRRLKERGIEKYSPIDALLRLKTEGYTHILIQSSNIIDGVEMEALRKDVASVAPFFKEIRIGTPLLYQVSDFEKVVDILKKDQQSKNDIVLVGHGTYTPSTASYAMLDYMLKNRDANNFHVGTVEGYPSYNEVVKLLKENKAKQVTLVPFMFVAGDHANNDIAGEWKDSLEKEGFNIDVNMKGLGENTDIQNMFVDKIRFIMHHKMLNIVDKKKNYAAGADAH